MKYFLKCFKQYVDFKGRARRREFWFFALFCSIISLILIIGIAVPIVKQVADNTSFYCATDDTKDEKAAIHTENLNEANAEEILNLLTEKGIVDLPAEVTENADAKITKAQVVTVNANNLDDETVKDLFDMLQKNGIVDEELVEEVTETKSGCDEEKVCVAVDCDQRVHNMIIRKMAKNPFYWIYLVFCLAILLPSIAVSVRRLHDIGRCGWWYLLFVVLTALPQLAFQMELGKVVTIISCCIAVPVLVWYIVWLCIDSQPGENKWGPNPKELSQPQD